ncbi:MAG TPA: O-antigen ligase family protein [bacterium]|nr:O-antigen ligase family protein [bacterium]HPT29338.1 O-antigen ligase family protein [bacterium]
MKFHYSWQKLLENSIEVVYLAVIFLLPLLFALIVPNANVFELNKTVYFRLAVAVLAFLSLGRYLFYGGVGRNFKKTYYLAPLLFIAFAVLSCLWSPDKALSFFGLYDRQEGALSYLFFGLWCLLLVYNLGYGDLKRKINRIIVVITLSASLVGLYAWLQMMALDPIVWSEPAFLTQRATSTLGQPNFLASFLLLTWPLAIYLLKRAKTMWWRLLWLIGLILQLGAIYFTLSRAAWLGLAVAIGWSIVWGIRKLKKNKQLSKKNIYFGLVGLTVILAGLLFWGFTNQGSIGQRLRSGLDWQSGSVGPRLTFWRDSLAAIYQKPLAGYGLENQESVFIKYYEKDWAINGYVNARTNRAHNFILDLALGGGIILAGLYLYLLWELYQLLREKKTANPWNSYLFLGLLGYFISLLFGFSFVAGQIYFWLYLSLAIVGKEVWQKNNQPSFLAKRIAPAWLLSLWILLVPFLLLGIKLQLASLTADHYFYLLRNNFNAGKYLEAANYFEKIQVLPSLQSKYYDSRYIALWYDSGLGGVADKQSEAMSGQLEGLLDAKAQGYSDSLNQAKLNGLLKNYDLSEKLFLDAIHYTPSLPENYLALARLYLYQGKLDQALAYLEEAQRLVPDSNDPRLNPLHQKDVASYLATLEYYLGDVSLRRLNYPAARLYYQSALRHFYDLRLYKKIADTYYLERNLDRALWYNKRAMVLDPSNYSWPLAISYLYQELGDQAKFQEYQAIAKKLWNKK